MNYLIVPRLNNSGPSHWQSFWAKSLPNASRVYQRCWDNPQKEEWVATLDETVKQLKGDTILVSHSLGSVTTVFWLLRAQERRELPANIKGVFLVAPADTDVVTSIRIPTSANGNRAASSSRNSNAVCSNLSAVPH